MDQAAVITDPARLLISLGAVLGLFASWAWMKVWAAQQPNAQQSGRAPRNHMGSAAFLTTATFALVSVGYLFGRLTGRF